MGRLEEQYRGMQSTCAAEVAAACADRALHKETLQKVQQLTSLNHKLTAAVAVAQLQAAVGVQDLLSQVVPALVRASHFFTIEFFRLDCPRCQANRLSIRLNFFRKRRFELLSQPCMLWSFFCAAVFTSLADPAAIRSSRKYEVWSCSKC